MSKRSGCCCRTVCRNGHALVGVSFINTMRETIFEMRNDLQVDLYKRELSVCELGPNPLQFVIATAAPTTSPNSASMTASNPGQVVRRHIRNPGAGSLRQQDHFQA